MTDENSSAENPAPQNPEAGDTNPMFPGVPPAEQPVASAPPPPEPPVESATHYAPPVAAPAEPQPPASQDHQPRHGVGVGTAILIGALVALLVSTVVGLAAGYIGARLGLLGAPVAGISSTSKTPATVTVIPPKTAEPVAAAAAAAVPSVVNINVSGGSSGSNASSSSQAPFAGTGSGVAIKSAPGGGTYIVTNNHVVEGATTIQVQDPAGDTWNGKLIGRDPDTDIAVVEVPGKIPLIRVANSNKLLVGQMAIAIGSPFQLEHSVTAGVISALGRSLPDFTGSTNGTYPLVDVIQTDAAINPGNSGGALVERTGRLIGINSAIVDTSGIGQNAGVGFAIPSNTALKVANELISSGTVQHPFIGVIGVDATPQLAAQRKLAVSQGAYVVGFSSGSPAEKAGVQKGDVIVSVDGQPVRAMSDLILLIRRANVGETVQIGLYRGDTKKTVDVVVGEKPANLSVPQSQTPTTP